MEQENTKKFRQDLADIFVRSLNEKQLDWKKGWNVTKTGLPVNAVTGRRYTGINAVYLYLNALEACNWNAEEADSRWATYKQIQKKGWRLKENSKGKGRKVEFWQPYDFNEKKEITWEEYNDRRNEKGIKLLSKYYTVFNGHDIIGIPELERVRTSEGRVVLDDPLINKISSGMGVPITNDGRDSAYYKPSDDTIHLPAKEAFQDSYEYNVTALHELSHASGAAHRLNRVFDNYSMESRAYEELVAEMSACFMAEHLEMQQTEKHIENHKAYVQSWIQGIQKQPEILGKAIHDAENAANYLEFHAGILSQKEYLNRNVRDDRVQNQISEQGTENIIDAEYMRKSAQESEQIRRSADPHAFDFLDTAKGLKMQYAIPLVNGDILHIDKEQGEEQNLNKILDDFKHKLRESYLIIEEEQYDISVSKDIYNNRCTVHFKDYSFYNDPEKGRIRQYSSKHDIKKGMVELSGEQFNVNFPSLEEAEIRRIVSGYLKERDMFHNAEIGERVTFYIPTKEKGGFQDINGIEKVEGKLRAIQDKTYIVTTADGDRQVIIDKIYDNRQVKVMENALNSHITSEYLDVLGNPKLSADQMEQALQGVKEGLTAVQVAEYANPKYEIWKMELYRYGMENGLSPYNIEKTIADNANQKEASRRKVDNLIKDQRNQIIRDLKGNGLLPEKHLVHDIEKLAGMTARPQTVKGIFSQINQDHGIPEIDKMRKQICGKINHQRKRMQIVNFQSAGQAMVR